MLCSKTLYFYLINVIKHCQTESFTFLTMVCQHLIAGTVIADDSVSSSLPPPTNQSFYNMYCKGVLWKCPYDYYKTTTLKTMARELVFCTLSLRVKSWGQRLRVVIDTSSLTEKGFTIRYSVNRSSCVATCFRPVLMDSFLQASSPFFTLVSWLRWFTVGFFYLESRCKATTQEP